MSNEKEKLWWKTQKNGGWKTLTNPLSRNHAVHARFDNLIKTFYWRFREKKGYPRSFYNPEINFQGFREFFTNEEGLLGHCDADGNIKEQETLINGKVVKKEKIYHWKISISINQFYLLSKLGMDKLITSYSATNVGYRNASLDKLINTIAHELAHAHQNTANLKKETGKKSQCESTGEKDSKGKLLYPWLAAEHTRLTAEIQQMIINSSEYQKFKTWWTSKKFPQQEEWEPYQDEENNYEEKPSSEQKKCENCGKVGFINFCKECAQAEEELHNFFVIIQNSKNLTDLEKNYQIAKSSDFYNSEKNDYEGKKKIDNFYTNTKNYLSNQSSQPNNHGKYNDGIKTIVLFLLIMGVIVIMGLLIFGQKKEKKRYYY